MKDHLGSTRATVNEKGIAVSYDDYDPWGMQLDGRSGNLASAFDKYKFTGKERDVETGYDYFGARYYDSRIARWMQVDPLAEKYPGWSPYNYILGNPTINIDPDGKAIFRKGEGYINGIKAKELTLLQMKSALDNSPAIIDFVMDTKTFASVWADLKDMLNGNTYSNGSMFNPNALQFGDNIQIGNKNFDEFFVDTKYSFQPIEYSDVQYIGTNGKGQEFVQLNFVTADDSKHDVIYFKGSVKKVNKFLEMSGKKLQRNVSTKTIKQDDEEFNQETIYYTIVDSE